MRHGEIIEPIIERIVSEWACSLPTVPGILNRT